jgi:uncharacterized protein YndB with AHSA1/START domain
MKQQMKREKVPEADRSLEAVRKMKIDASSRGQPVLVMERIFDAPREKVWDAPTDPKQVARWYGGYGFENPLCEMDVRPGGRWRHVMRAPDGNEYSCEFEFIEVVKPKKLVWRTAEPGPMSQGPHGNVMTVTLEAAGQRTRWKLLVNFRSFEDREAARQIGFSTVLAEGAEKLNELLRAR